MATRDELVVALAARYQSSNRDERGRILDEITEISGLHRKHAMRLLRAGQPNRRSGPRPERRLYDEAVREALLYDLGSLGQDLRQAVAASGADPDRCDGTARSS